MINQPIESKTRVDYLNRRQFIKNTSLLLGAAWAGRVAMPVQAKPMGDDFPHLKKITDPLESP